ARHVQVVEVAEAVTVASEAEAVAIAEVGGAASAATKELGVMAGEALRGNFGRLEQSTVTLANKGGLLAQAFTPMGAIFGVLAAAAFLMGDALYKYSEELSHFQNIVELTGGAGAH